MTINLNFWQIVLIIFVASLTTYITRAIASFLHAMLKKIYNRATEKIDIVCDYINKTVNEEIKYKKKTKEIGFVDRSSED